MTLTRLIGRGAVAALIAVVGALVVVSPAQAASTGTLVRQPAPAGQAYYSVALTVTYTNSAPTTYFRIEFDLPADTSVIPFNSLGFTRSGNHWVGQHSSPTPQTAGVRHSTGFAILGSQDPTNILLDGNPLPYTVLTDTQAPTTPGNVTGTRTTYPGAGPTAAVTLWWSPSTDNFAVTGYEVTVNGVVVTGQQRTFEGRLYQYVPGNTGATFTYAVRAYDAVRNYSAAGVFVLPPV
jgi:hypothetical protein